MNAKLQGAMSAELKRRMQGKACFNFKTVEATLFGELKKLTKEGHASFKAQMNL